MRLTFRGRSWAVIAVLAGASACGGETKESTSRGSVDASTTDEIPGQRDGNPSSMDSPSRDASTSLPADGSAEAAVAERPCRNSLDCAVGRVCDPSSGACVACLRDADCNAGDLCVSTRCLSECDSDNDCTAQGLLCDFAGGHCVQCLVDFDCSGPGDVCEGGWCAPGCVPMRCSEASGCGILPDGCGDYVDCPCPEPCTNGVKDGSESDVDCGGSCLACTMGRVCGQDADCQSTSCVAGTCQACSTGMKACGGICVPPAPNIGCSLTDCTPCTAPANATAACDGQQCRFTCAPGFVVTDDGLGCTTPTRDAGRDGAPDTADAQPPPDDGSSPHGSDAGGNPFGDGQACSPELCPDCGAVLGPGCCTAGGQCGCPLFYLADTCV